MPEPIEYTLAEVAEHIDAEVRGDKLCKVTGLAGLAHAGAGQISFLSDPRYAALLKDTQAAAVVVNEEMAALASVNVLVTDKPYLAFAKISRLFDNRPQSPAGIHPTATVDATARVAASASIGANVVVAAHAIIEAGAEIGAGSYVGTASQVGKDSRIAPNVTLYHQVTIGARAIIHSGAVVGADGFGFANDKGVWQKIAQLGGVKIGDDVEIGAGTTIDRGALQDTIIEDGVKIDNQVMVAHNVRIGQHTAIAACVGISGSTEIGRHCTIAGGVGFAGHITLTDHVFVTAMSLVTKSITRPGSYSSGTAMMPTQLWKKNSVRMRHLDDLVKQVKQLQNEINQLRDQGV